MAGPEISEEEIEISAAPAPVKQSGSWGPVLVAIILTPLISYAMTQYVLIPKMRESLIKSAVQGVALPGNGQTAQGAQAAASPGKKGEEKPTTFDCAFENIVVNVSGTKGTRYLKASFTMFSSNPALKEIINRRRIELLNLSQNILSAKTLVDLEVPGANNMRL
ncbi:MAG: flagellar basal body-associated FliL family protein, partial [Chthoniobacteraceae bacterium]|nr:flagellar basal body-associated FliL family protein [Chthoniobacteraceae bacterium]